MHDYWIALTGSSDYHLDPSWLLFTFVRVPKHTTKQWTKHKIWCGPFLPFNGRFSFLAVAGKSGVGRHKIIVTVGRFWLFLHSSTHHEPWCILPFFRQRFAIRQTWQRHKKNITISNNNIWISDHCYITTCAIKYAHVLLHIKTYQEIPLHASSLIERLWHYHGRSLACISLLCSHEPKVQHQRR